ncbi:hypothetical protein CH063_13996, partial [Colletotrichum higginsianum]
RHSPLQPPPPPLLVTFITLSRCIASSSYFPTCVLPPSRLATTDRRPGDLREMYGFRRRHLP